MKCIIFLLYRILGNLRVRKCSCVFSSSWKPWHAAIASFFFILSLDPAPLCLLSRTTKLARHEKGIWYHWCHQWPLFLMREWLSWLAHFASEVAGSIPAFLHGFNQYALLSWCHMHSLCYGMPSCNQTLWLGQSWSTSSDNSLDNSPYNI